MKNGHSILTALFLFCFIAISTAQISFYKVYQSDPEKDYQVFDITGLSSGGYAMIGIADNANGSSEVGLTKLSCDGTVEWAKLFGSSSTINNVFSAVIEADNGDIVFVNNVGVFQNYDFIIGRITPEGEVVWKKRYGGNQDDAGRGIVQTQDGNFVVTGGTSTWGTDSNTSAASWTDVYLTKINGEDGDVIWSQTYGNAEAIDAGYAVTEDAEGNLFSTGRYLVGGTF